MSQHYLQHAPRGITGIQLDNGDEAIYLHGDFIACSEPGEGDAPVLALGKMLAATMDVPFQLLTHSVPDDEKWAWNDVTDALGWGKRITVPRMMMRPIGRGLTRKSIIIYCRN